MRWLKYVPLTFLVSIGYSQVNLDSTAPSPQIRGLLQPANGGLGISTAGANGCLRVTSGVWSVSMANCAGGGGSTYLTSGSNVTITGAGTSVSPYVVNSTGASVSTTVAGSTNIVSSGSPTAGYTLSLPSTLTGNFLFPSPVTSTGFNVLSNVDGYSYYQRLGVRPVMSAIGYDYFHFYGGSPTGPPVVHDFPSTCPGGGAYQVTETTTAGITSDTVVCQPTPNTITIQALSTDSVAAAVGKCPTSSAIACVVTFDSGSHAGGGLIVRDNWSMTGTKAAAFPANGDDSALIAGSGTIITGGLSLQGSNIVVEKVGIDLGSAGGNCTANSTDGLTIEATSGVNGTPFHNVLFRDDNILLCDAHGVHATLATAIDGLTFDNVRTSHGAYGHVLFGSNIKDLNGSSSHEANPLIVKSTNSGVTIATAEVDVSDFTCESGGLINFFALGTTLTDVRASSIHMTGCAGMQLNATSPGLFTHAKLDGIFLQSIVAGAPTTCSTGILLQGVDDVSIQNAVLDGCSSAGVNADASSGTVSVAHSTFTNMVGKPIISSANVMNLYDIGIGSSVGGTTVPINDYAVTANAGHVFVNDIHGNTNQASFFNPVGSGIISPMIYPGDTYSVGYKHMLNVVMSTGTVNETLWAKNPFVAGMVDFDNHTTISPGARFFFAGNANMGMRGTNEAGCGGQNLGQGIGFYRSLLESGQGCVGLLDFYGNLALSGSLYASTSVHIGTGAIFSSAPGFGCNVSSGPTLPAGSLNYYPNGSGVSDTFQACTQNADGTFTWKTILGGGASSSTFSSAALTAGNIAYGAAAGSSPSGLNITGNAYSLLVGLTTGTPASSPQVSNAGPTSSGVLANITITNPTTAYNPICQANNGATAALGIFAGLTSASSGSTTYPVYVQSLPAGSTSLLFTCTASPVVTAANPSNVTGTIAGVTPGPVADGEGGIRAASYGSGDTASGASLNNNAGVIAFWVNVDIPTDAGDIVKMVEVRSATGSSAINVGVFQYGGGLYFNTDWVNNTGATYNGQHTAPFTSGWHRVVLTWAPSTLAMYVDGSAVNADTYSGVLDSGSFNVQLFPIASANTVSANPGKGMSLAKVLLGNQMWSSSQVSADYATPTPTTYTGSGCNSNVDAYYKAEAGVTNFWGLCQTGTNPSLPDSVGTVTFN